MNAKFQKIQAYKYKDNAHYRHAAIIPGQEVATLGSKGGQVLDVQVKNGNLVFEKREESLHE